VLAAALDVDQQTLALRVDRLTPRERASLTAHLTALSR
jgi:hypothetical protein